MTSAGIGYFSLDGTNEKEFVRWDMLDALPGEEIAPEVRHVRLAHSAWGAHGRTGPPGRHLVILRCRDGGAEDEARHSK